MRVFLLLFVIFTTGLVRVLFAVYSRKPYQVETGIRIDGIDIAGYVVLVGICVTEDILLRLLVTALYLQMMAFSRCATKILKSEQNVCLSNEFSKFIIIVLGSTMLLLVAAVFCKE
ncbi:hypothetical protein [Intestinimonas sp.]|uniref:hypothetical protein n=1 Tax=Intestinimonas sp. TaxID=1965293 RepID=UPI0026389457|nr:hypothetical protein [Intestinimonas sp.]